MSTKLDEYDTYFITGHGSISPDKKLFTTVPDDMIFVLCTQNIDSFMISSESEYQFTRKLVKYGDKFLRESLLVENNDLPNTHLLKNKAIYMPNSCIPNLILNFTDNNLSTGVFKTSVLNENIHYKNIPKGGKFIPNKYSIYKKTIGLETDIFILLEDVLRTLSSRRTRRKKIVYMSVCTAVWFNKLHSPSMYEKIFGYNKKLSDKEKNKLEIDFVSAMTKCNYNCYLYSLELFTKQFKTYSSSKVKSFLKEGKNKSGVVKDVNIRKPHHIISDKLILKYTKEYFEGNKSLPTKIFNFISTWLGFNQNESENRSESRSTVVSLSTPKLTEYLESDSLVKKYIELEKNLDTREIDENVYNFVCSQSESILDETELYKTKKSKLRDIESTLKRKRKSSSGDRTILVRKLSRFI